MLTLIRSKYTRLRVERETTRYSRKAEKEEASNFRLSLSSLVLGLPKFLVYSLIVVYEPPNCPRQPVRPGFCYILTPFREMPC